ncbi:hypothetical protein SAMN05443245_0317 [Paraburkholderia fungorum]|uniref:Uncharacterized protein n=1 Tax=Paraburkholderia fungorum TaxID=134537 RepID=A0A1H0YWF8_9BURK|nr:hypothetical protein [Paraburkholderia fungorum]SDQ19460.1 hypothetical protein SAMN05443245_0317 [Paraburkholderia fungorum]
MVPVTPAEKATHFNSLEAKSKFWASIVGMAAGGAAFAGRTVEAAIKTPLRLPGFLTKDAAEGLLKAGRYLAVPGALVGVGWDISNMVSQWREGHVGWPSRTAASAGFSLALLFCVTTELFAASVLPLTLLLIAISLVIMFFKESELKEFLGRSYFGTNKKADRFTSFEEEQEAYYGLGA